MQTDLTLVIGNRNFSSWSLRAWLARTWTEAPFEEVHVWFDEDSNRTARLRHSPTGRVPILKVGELVIWDSLAIAEYLAETFPAAQLWPADPAARARARSLVCEMHSSFEALRSELPMNCRARKPARVRRPDVQHDIEQLCAHWTETRAAYGASGPYLFGERPLADAFYAPVASRFRTYDVQLTGAADAYAQALFDLPGMKSWLEQAESEGHDLPAYAESDG